jgi:hypothetical protein
MEALTTAIVLWISANFGLPPPHDLPTIEFASASKIVALRYGGHGDAAQVSTSTLDEAIADTLAIYRDDTQTIYLREDWTGKTPAELSILVHEIVHHLQTVDGIKFECPQEREDLAYKAQEKWLGLFGHSLQSDFGLDSFSVFFKSKCF